MPISLCCEAEEANRRRATNAGGSHASDVAPVDHDSPVHRAAPHPSRKSSPHRSIALIRSGEVRLRLLGVHQHIAQYPSLAIPQETSIC